MKIGLVGSGYWAETVHGPALKASDSVEFIGVWGRNHAEVERLAAKFGVRAYSSLDALIHDVDSLDFAVPPEVQKSIALRAAQAGKHLLLEKPLAVNVADADELVRVFNESSISTLVFHTTLFQSDLSEWVRAAGKASWTSGLSTWVSDALSAATSPFRASKWRNDRGALWDIGPHVVSVLISLLGPVSDVVAVAGPSDTVHLLLTHAEGRTSSSTLSLNGPPGHDVVNLRVWNDETFAHMPESEVNARDALISALGELSSHIAGKAPAPRSDAAYAREIVAVLDEAQQQIDARRKLTT